MKQATKSILFLVFAFVVSSAHGQQLAKEALRSLAKSKGGDILGRVVQISGIRGQDQPKAWSFLVSDGSTDAGYRSFVVEGGTVVAERAVRPGVLSKLPTRAIPIRNVKLDSKDAFYRADLAAKDAKIGFDSIGYQLESRADTGEPIWTVTLVDRFGMRVGRVDFSASSGRALSKEWANQKPQAVASRPTQTKPKPKPVVRKVQPRQQPVARTNNQPVQTVARPLPKKKAAAPRRQVQFQPGQRPAQQQTAPVPTNYKVESEIGRKSGEILEKTRRGLIKTGGKVGKFFNGVFNSQQQ